MKEVLPQLLGGLVLFIFAISQLSVTMRGIFTDKARDIIENSTRNLFLAIIIGTLLTILLGSSSAVIIMTIVFINARSLSFRNAMGVIMGANIGTTFSSQIIALDIMQFAVIPLAIGVAFEILAKNKRSRQIGRAILYFGMLFFGLYTMEQSVVPLRDSEQFHEWILGVERNYVKGALLGGVITLILQSSSATVGMAIVLGKQQLISTAGGLAIMLGAELGTCSDTLIATIGGTRQAIKAGVFHLAFNLITIILGLLLFPYFLDLVNLVSGKSDIAHHIANGHMLFNITGVIVFLPFVRLMEKALNSSIPEKA
jgi:phosphate:Na+ symporter